METPRNLKVEVTERGPRGAELSYGIADAVTGELIVQTDGEAFSFSRSSAAWAFIEGYTFAHDDTGSTRKAESGDDKVYGFRIGSRDYPSKIAGPFDTHAEAKEAAYRERCAGSPTGRIRGVTRDVFEGDREAFRRGILPRGW